MLQPRQVPLAPPIEGRLDHALKVLRELVKSNMLIGGSGIESNHQPFECHRLCS